MLSCTAAVQTDTEHEQNIHLSASNQQTGLRNPGENHVDFSGPTVQASTAEIDSAPQLINSSGNPRNGSMSADSSTQNAESNTRSASGYVTGKTENIQYRRADGSYMPVVKVLVNGKHLTKVGLDTMSSDTLCTEMFSRRVGLQQGPMLDSMTVATMTGSVKMKNTPTVSMTLESVNKIGDKIHLKNIPTVPCPIVINKAQNDVEQYEHLRDLVFSVPEAVSEVDMIIGVDNSEVMCPLQVHKGKKDEPFATLTMFGMVLHGKKSVKSSPVDSRPLSSQYVTAVAAFGKPVLCKPVPGNESVYENPNPLQVIMGSDVTPQVSHMTTDVITGKKMNLSKSNESSITGESELVLPPSGGLMQGPHFKPAALVSENETCDQSNLIIPQEQINSQVHVENDFHLTEVSISGKRPSPETDNDPVVPDKTEILVSHEHMLNESSRKENAYQSVVDTSKVNNCYSSAMILTGVMKQARRSAQPSLFDLFNMKCPDIITYATTFVKTAVRMKLFPHDIIPTCMVMSPYQWLTKLNLSSNDGVSHPPTLVMNMLAANSILCSVSQANGTVKNVKENKMTFCITPAVPHMSDVKTCEQIFIKLCQVNALCDYDAQTIVSVDRPDFVSLYNPFAGGGGTGYDPVMLVPDKRFPVYHARRPPDPTDRVLCWRLELMMTQNNPPDTNLTHSQVIKSINDSLTMTRIHLKCDNSQNDYS